VVGRVSSLNSNAVPPAADVTTTSQHLLMILSLMGREGWSGRRKLLISVDVLVRCLLKSGSSVSGSQVYRGEGDMRLLCFRDMEIASRQKSRSLIFGAT
jgi:hypothetical protein